MNLSVGGVCGHSYLPGLFGDKPAVMDAGFNRGEFSRAMMDAHDATVFAVEPSRELFDARVDAPRLQVWRVALGGREEQAFLHHYKARDASLLGAARVALAKRRLGLAGFRRIDFSLDNTDVLFVRVDVLPWVAWLWLRHAVRNWS